MTVATPTDLITVGQAASKHNILVQKLHKAIRDGDILAHEDPRTGKRMVSAVAVKDFLENNVSRRGRPKGSVSAIRAKAVREGDFIVRAVQQEIIRHVDVVTGSSEEFFTRRALLNGEPDQYITTFKQSDARKLIEQDKMFVLDRWAFLTMLAESFKITGEQHISDDIMRIADQYKETSERMLAEAREKDRAEFEQKKLQWMIENDLADDPNIGLNDEGNDE